MVKRWYPGLRTPPVVWHYGEGTTLRMIVHRRRLDAKGWYLTAYGLNIENVELKHTDILQAKGEALAIVRGKILELAKEVGVK